MAKTKRKSNSVDRTTLDTVKSLAESMDKMAAMMVEFKELAGVIRAESLYLMHASQRDRASKELLPHYSLLLNLMKGSNVFLTQDAYKANLAAINDSFAALDAKVAALQEEVKTSKGGRGKWFSSLSRRATRRKSA